MKTKNGCKLRKVMATAAFGLALALSAGAAGDRLAISFSIWALYDMTPGGTFADPAKTMEGLKRRGYNAIRLDDGAGLYAVPRTTSGPEDPSWNLRPDDLRRVNDLFCLD